MRARAIAESLIVLLICNAWLTASCNLSVMLIPIGMAWEAVAAERDEQHDPLAYMVAGLILFS
ncbi:Uncharacterised protein [Yersinia aleksiciae]|uniref:Uncharacterized protein n=1 Tax=Yersinia aleksiciae TaxID=263819 RepID=A0A0T9V0W9_YERAE|nr:Uncharacterised protein [Yersinia aleksiciae]